MVSPKPTTERVQQCKTHLRQNVARNDTLYFISRQGRFYDVYAIQNNRPVILTSYIADALYHIGFVGTNAMRVWLFRRSAHNFVIPKENSHE